MKKTLNATLVALLSATCLHAQSVPALINYQGRLTDNGGAPLSAGFYGIQFKVWDSATLSGTNDLVWGQQQALAVQTNGVFNVILGGAGGSPLTNATPAVNNLAYAFTGSNCFLGVTIVVSNGTAITSPSEIVPRQQLLSVPFAMQAQQAQRAVLASSLVSNLANALCPPGTIVAFGGPTQGAGSLLPAGWRACNGDTVSRSQYPALFAAIGTVWGVDVGDSSTFQLPDLRGVFLRGVDTNRGFDPDAATRFMEANGVIVGDRVGSYEADMFASHFHPAHNSHPGGGILEGDANPSFYVSSGSGLGFRTYIESIAVGGSETRPKNKSVNYIIKY